MGLLEQLAGALAGNTIAATGAAGSGVISPALVQQVIAMLGSGTNGGAGAARAGALGSLGGLMGAFEQGGLGHIFQSWVANGANLPVTSAQLQQVLGQGQLAQIANALGLDHATAAGGLAQVLPELVNHLTPGGQLPAAGEAQSALAELARQLGPR
jgi:uncharacterized protein YidB (DUF937 family)